MRDIEYLQEAVRSCWDMIVRDLIDSAIDEWSKRDTAIIQVRGHRYWSSTEVEYR